MGSPSTRRIRPWYSDGKGLTGLRTYLKYLGVLGLLASGLAVSSAPAIAAAPPATTTSTVSPMYGHPSTTQPGGTTSQTVSPNGTVYCGTGVLSVIDVMKTSFLTYWQLNSTQGNIVWEDVNVSVSPGKGTQTYDGVGPIVSATGDGDFTWYNLVPGTFYTVNMWGTFDTDNGTQCTINQQPVYIQM
jgi:hypothetical protein